MSLLTASRRGLIRGLLPALVVGTIDPAPSLAMSPIMKRWLGRPAAKAAMAIDPDLAPFPYDTPEFLALPNIGGPDYRRRFALDDYDRAILKETPTCLLDLSIQAALAVEVPDIGRFTRMTAFSSLPESVLTMAKAQGLPHPLSLLGLGAQR
jgi:hypothetical protein